MKKLNVKALRKRNILEVVNAIAASDGIARATIAQEAGVSVMTISNIMDVLLENNVVYELEQHTENVGRNPSLVYFSKTKRILVFDLSKDDFRCFLLNLYMEELDQFVFEFDQKLSYQTNFDRFLADVKKRYEKIADELVGIGVCTPAVYNPETDYVECPRIPALRTVRIKETIKKYFTCKICADEDVKFAAVAAAQKESGINLLYAYMGSGVGGAVVMDGAVVPGHDGYTGDIGQMELPDGTRYEQLLSWSVLLKQLQQFGVEESDQMEALWDSPNKDIRTCLEGYANTAGNMLYNACCLLSPDTVIIEGGCRRLGKELVRRIATYAETRFVPSSRKAPKWVLIERRLESGIVGAGIRARERWIKTLV